MTKKKNKFKTFNYWITIILILSISIAYMINAIKYGQSNPILLHKIIINNNPKIEAEIIISVQNACGIKNTISEIKFKTIGSTNTTTGNITINENLSDDIYEVVSKHELCHQRQVEEGRFKNITDKDCFEIKYILEKECKYEGMNNEVKEKSEL